MAALWIKGDLRAEEEEGCLVQSLVVEAAAQRQHIAISNCMTMVQMPFTLLLKNRQGRGMSFTKQTIQTQILHHPHRDQYGFLKSSQWISEDAFNGFENYYAPIMKRRSLKWRQLLAENDDQWPARSSKSKMSSMSIVNQQLTDIFIQSSAISGKAFRPNWEDRSVNGMHFCKNTCTQLFPRYLGLVALQWSKSKNGRKQGSVLRHSATSRSAGKSKRESWYHWERYREKETLDQTHGWQGQH